MDKIISFCSFLITFPAETDAAYELRRKKLVYKNLLLFASFLYIFATIFYLLLFYFCAIKLVFFIFCITELLFILLYFEISCQKCD